MAKVIKFEPNTKYVKDIVTDYDKLSERCQEFDLTKENKDAQEIVLYLKNTIRANKDMLGLSANQIGFDKRVMCLNFNGNIRTFINPIITNVGDLTLSREKCHSEPGKEYIRVRHGKVSVTYQTPLGKIESTDLIGVAATTFQHHNDHLDGLLLSDVALEIDDQWDKATDEERQEVIELYLDSLDLSRKELQGEIENDEEAKKTADAIRFINSVQSGETKLEAVEMTPEEIEEYENVKAELEAQKDKKKVD